MASKGTHKILENSHRQMPQGAMILGAPHPNTACRVGVRLRRRSKALPALGKLAMSAPSKRRYMTREQFEAEHGATRDAVNAVARFASSFGLQVESVDLAQRLVVLWGPVRAVERAFRVDLRHVAHVSGQFMSHEGPVSVPHDLESVVESVHGLDQRPVARPQAHDLKIDSLSPAHRSKGNLRYAVAAAAAIGIAESRESQARAGYYGALASAATNPRTAGRVLTEGLQDYLKAVSGAKRQLNAELRELYLEETGMHSPPQVARLYDFPKDLDGSGQTVGLLQFGGGFDLPSLIQYFAFFELPLPKISVVSVGGVQNKPGANPLYDTEVMLDMEVCGGAAPGVHLVVYFAPLSEMGFLSAFTTAIHDKVHRPSIISVSWALAEPQWKMAPTFLKELDELFQEAALLGVTICIASGDHGSIGTKFSPDGRADVDFPGSSPHVLACGGTRLVAQGGAVASERVWNDLGVADGASGGGISQFFEPPSYQSDITLPRPINTGDGPGRGVPDVAGNGDPLTGYLLLVNGTPKVTAGTSSVAPLWSALLARINQGLGAPVGFINPLIYQKLSNTDAFRSITEGNNGGYVAGPSWDACTGWGVPNGTRIFEELKNM